MTTGYDQVWAHDGWDPNSPIQTGYVKGYVVWLQDLFSGVSLLSRPDHAPLAYSVTVMWQNLHFSLAAALFA